MTAVAYNHEDRLIEETRRSAAQASGRGMHVTVSGEHLRATLGRLDHLSRTVAAIPPPEDPPEPTPAWQEPLAGVLPILDDILQGDAYVDLVGCNLIDALMGWAARNDTTIDPAALTAVSRALAGG